MSRRDAMDYQRPQVSRMSSYHGGDFRTLTAFNSDRKIKLADDYTVSAENTESAKKICKVGSRLKLIGLEVETVGEPIRLGSTAYTNLLDLIFSKSGFDDDFFKIEADCTVNGECITQTFTKGWLRNNYKSWKAMYELFEVFKITTADQRCGMHVNLDLRNFGDDFETQCENVRKLGYVINKHYDLFRVAFNRTGTTTWCPRMNTTMDYWKNTDFDYIPTSHDRCCINVGHIRQNRIEIRLVGGQTNYPCFRNTMETVLFLVDRICKLSWKNLDDIVTIFSGCNRYVLDRLSTNCLNARVITSENVEKIRAKANMTERFL